MGVFFRMKHVNIMSYLTSRSYGPPQIMRQDLHEFLMLFLKGYGGEEYFVAERGFDTWPNEMSSLAETAMNKLEKISIEDDYQIVHPPTVEHLLEELRSALSVFPLFALAVGDRIRKQAREIAQAPLYGQLLVLIPDNVDNNRNFEVLDPIPTFSAALHAISDWPGFLFWTQTGANTFVPKRYASDFVMDIQSVLDHFGRHRPFQSDQYKLDKFIKDWFKKRTRQSRRLLHLSDLHFGTTDAVENQALLDAQLRDVVQDVDKVVITGDLIHTTKRNDYRAMYQTFRNNIVHLANGKEPISITGNHDQRMLGIFGDDYRQVTRIGSRGVIIDDECKIIFICFNSSEDGNVAQGCITKSQFREIGGEYRNYISARPELKSYLPIVLLHHHPFSFDVEPETRIQRILNKFGIGDERFLKLLDAEDLHHWCMDWDVKTILHGHKHKALYLERLIKRDDKSMLLTAIGCGSSLGAEGSPLSYNMLEWDHNSQRWVGSLFESYNGGAFREKVLAVSPNQ